MKITCPYGSDCETFDKTGLVTRCGKYMNVVGTNPQTGELQDQWRCSDVTTALLLIDVIKELRGVHAATNSFRNEMVKDNQALLETSVKFRQIGLIQ